jgi:hypothetical protein
MHYKIIIALLLVLGAFYWFELRPSMIKKDCSSYALKNSMNADEKTYDQTTYNGEYKRCTEMKGL